MLYLEVMPQFVNTETIYNVSNDLKQDKAEIHFGIKMLG